jgi:glycerophosphoryl diester phosphodiesterase
MKMIVSLLLSFLVLSCAVAKKTTSIKTEKNPVVAHRGAWKKNGLPENSIASLRQAIKIGCAGSEFDVRMTADNVLVINHDPSYHSLTIEKSIYSDLLSFPLSNGEKLPTLREYLLAGLENNTNTQLVCEIKPSDISKERAELIATQVVQLVQELNAQDRVMYISFEYSILKKIKSINSQASTQYLEVNKTPEELLVDKIDGLDYYYKDFKYHPEWISSAHKNKMILNAWTVNESDDMDWLLANGFDYITTNEPELLLQKIELLRR